MKDDKFKKLIQHVSLDEPGDSFTDNVMKTIESEEVLSLHPALLQILKNELITQPSAEFSNNLITSIQPKANKIAAPVISKKFKFIVSGVIISILIVALITSKSKFNYEHYSYFSNFVLNFSNVIIGTTKITASVLQYLVPLAILLLIDYMFRTRQRQLTTRK
jgi:hypothetical protein